MLKTLGRLALGASLLTASLPALAAPPLLEYGDKTYQGEALPGALRQAFYELELQQNQQKRQAADQYVFNRYLQEEAERRNLPVRTLQQQLLAVEEPTEAELRAVYQANQGRIQGSFEQVRDDIANYLKNQQAAGNQQQLLERIKAEKGYRLDLSEPEPPRFELSLEGYPTKGPADAPVTLVEFADYQCPHCKQAGPVVEKLLARYGDKVRLVFKDFPINASGKSLQVAEAAVCADRQDRFWDFHNLAFERQQFLGSVTPQMLAEELELDMEAFNRCYTSDEGDARVAASATEARQLGVSGTPAFFVNGRPLADSHSDLEAKLIAAIEAELDD